MNMQNFSSSVPTNYFTPKKRSQTGQKSSYNKSEKSTASKYYDLENSFKQYEKLLQENLYLKDLVTKDNLTNQKSAQKMEQSSLFKETQKFNDRSENTYRKNPSTKCMSTNAFNQTFENSEYDVAIQTNQFYDNDIALWSVKQRNKYLQKKLANLQNQYTKQSKTIDKIVHSQKWKNRFDCNESNCYLDRYMRLLRVKSPVLLE